MLEVHSKGKPIGPDADLAGLAKRIGAFELFVSPVEAVGDDRRYEALVDRSVGAPASPPAAAPTPAAAAPAPAPAEAPVPPAAAASASAAPPIRRARLLRRATLRRLGRGARAEIHLRPRPVARTVRVRLVRKGVTLARGSAAVTAQHALVRLKAPGHLPAGDYLLVVSTIDAGGVVRSQRSRVTLR